jgi:hypothetical protein
MGNNNDTKDRKPLKTLENFARFREFSEVFIEVFDRGFQEFSEVFHFYRLYPSQASFSKHKIDSRRNESYKYPTHAAYSWDTDTLITAACDTCSARELTAESMLDVPVVHRNSL